jgi:YbbR domain-containing protein
MRDWITKDLGWKIFSLLLAVAIWLTVHKIYEEPKISAEPSTVSPVTYGNLPVWVVSTTADVHDFRVVPGTISVTVSGPPDVMAVLQANQIRATVDLTGIESAKDLRRRVDVSTPLGVTLVSVVPPRVGVIVPPVNVNK